MFTVNRTKTNIYSVERLKFIFRQKSFAGELLINDHHKFNIDVYVNVYVNAPNIDPNIEFMIKSGRILCWCLC